MLYLFQRMIASHHVSTNPLARVNCATAAAIENAGKIVGQSVCRAFDAGFRFQKRVNRYYGDRADTMYLKTCDQGVRGNRTCEKFFSSTAFSAFYGRYGCQKWIKDKVTCVFQMIERETICTVWVHPDEIEQGVFDLPDHLPKIFGSRGGEPVAVEQIYVEELTGHSDPKTIQCVVTICHSPASTVMQRRFLYERAAQHVVDVMVKGEI